MTRYHCNTILLREDGWPSNFAALAASMSHQMCLNYNQRCCLILRLTCTQLWDLRAKRSAHTMAEDYQILAVAFAEAGDQVYTGGIENVIKVRATLRVHIIWRIASPPCSATSHAL